MKMIFVVENVGGLGVKLTKKEGKLEAKFEWKLMFQEFNSINWKLKFNDRTLKNYLGCTTYWWFWGENNKERGKTGGKICTKTNVSRIQPNQRKGPRWRERFWKVTSMLKMFTVWGSRQQRNRANWGQNFNKN